MRRATPSNSVRVCGRRSPRHDLSDRAGILHGVSRRWVLHLDMDAFFASVEQLTRPTLRGRPVLVGGLGGRGVVAGASYEARVYGARSAMPMHQARRLVGPGAVVLPPRGRLYGMLSKSVFDSLRGPMPVLEQLSMDEAFGEPAELAGADAAMVQRYCEGLRTLVLERTGLVASIGAGSGKQVAKIASGLAKPDGITVIPPDEQHAVLDELPVRKLWGIGPVAEEKLKRLGIETIGGFARTPESEVASILGTTIGPGLHRLAQGIDNRPWPSVRSPNRSVPRRLSRPTSSRWPNCGVPSNRARRPRSRACRRTAAPRGRWC